MGKAIMSKAITKEDMALLKDASEMFEETGCVPGIDGEQVPAEKIERGFDVKLHMLIAVKVGLAKIRQRAFVVTRIHWLR
jgi:hypothetical protein